MHYLSTDPSRVRSQLFGTFENLFDDFFNDFWKEPIFGKIKSVNSYPKINVGKDENFFIIEATVAGVSPEDVKVEIKDGMVNISGVIKESEGVKYNWKEISHREFWRAIALPDDICEKDPVATIKDGILTLKWELPKEVISKDVPRQIPVQRLDP